MIKLFIFCATFVGIGEAKAFEPNVRVNCDSLGDQISPFLVSSSESLYVVWNDSGSGGIRFSKSANGGLDWSTSNPWINDTTFSAKTYPSIAIAGNILYVAWENAWRFDKSTDYGVNWGIDVCPSDTLCGVISPNTCSFVANGDTIYMVFLRSPLLTLNFQVYFVKSEDGGVNWTKAKRISASPMGLCYAVSLAIDEMSNIYAVWRDEMVIGFTKSSDGGVNWTPPTHEIADSTFIDLCP